MAYETILLVIVPTVFKDDQLNEIFEKLNKYVKLLPTKTRSCKFTVNLKFNVYAFLPIRLKMWNILQVWLQIGQHITFTGQILEANAQKSQDQTAPVEKFCFGKVLKNQEALRWTLAKGKLTFILLVFYVIFYFQLKVDS